MANYSFVKFSILVVDDSDFIRSLMGSTLKNLGVGHIAYSADGGGAIGYLKSTASRSRRTAHRAVDIVISDLVMDPVDGMVLLRWIRRHEESPNHFVPFILFSSYLDIENVREARNLGANGFLTKPFTANGVSDHLVQLVERPRQFVRTKTYFGPDRRNKPVEIKHEERRAISGSEGEEVWDRDNPDLRFFRLPNSLKAKALEDVADTDEPLGLDGEKLALAESEIEKWTEDYADWAQEHVRSLRSACMKAMTGDSDWPRALRAVDGIRGQLQNEGDVLGYPLLGEISRSLGTVVRGGGAVTDIRLRLIRDHIDALDVVVRNRMKEDGGEAGQTLLRSLREAQKKVIFKPGA